MLDEVPCLPLAQASAKVRSGPPLDDEGDLALPHRAGVVRLRLAPAPVRDAQLAEILIRRPGAEPEIAPHWPDGPC